MSQMDMAAKMDYIISDDDLSKLPVGANAESGDTIEAVHAVLVDKCILRHSNFLLNENESSPPVINVVGI